MKRMYRVLGSLVLAAAAFVGCRGSTDRVYFDDLTGLDGGLDANNGSSSSSSGDGSTSNGKERDSSLDGPPPATAPAKIGGTVLGLLGAGLVLQNNAGDDLAVTAGGAFVFPTEISPGQPYAVTVRSQPTGPTQTCTVSPNGVGTAKGVDVLDLLITCNTETYTVGGIVLGLVGTGLVLQNNSGNDLPILASGPFTFTNKVQSGGNFNVVVKTQASGGQTCNVSGGSGTIITDPVDSVVVNCAANTFTVGGRVEGLSGTLVITNNDGNNRTVSSNGAFAFSTPISNGAPYNVKIKTQPAYPPANQTCVVSSPSGTVNGVNVDSVLINCTTTRYSVGGTVSGLVATGLVLRLNNSNSTPVNADGAFTFANTVASGAPYSVTVLTQPPGQACSVSAGAGTVRSGPIANVVVSCAQGVVLNETFDGREEPALPPGWTAVPGRVGTDDTWETIDEHFASPPNAAYIGNSNRPRDFSLVSPSIAITSASAKLSFFNRYDTEGKWDGGVLEIAIDGGAWTDILAAGGAFTAGPYNDTIDPTAVGSTIAGRAAWTGFANTTTRVNLPAAAMGKNIQLRWRFASDEGDSEEGWWIDDVVVSN